MSGKCSPGGNKDDSKSGARATSQTGAEGESVNLEADAAETAEVTEPAQSAASSEAGSAE